MARARGPVGRALLWFARHPAAVALILAATLALAGAVATAHAQQEARRQEVLEGNVYAARAVAGAVLAQLWHYGVLVSGSVRSSSATAAGSPRLQRAAIASAAVRLRRATSSRCSSTTASVMARARRCTAPS
ncbi:hypothetical protein WME97_29735 [Sorangium sp. So ce367]|uniref:hypothetical protein n=1 Tax=Sorangium sp. So ce367 TaxID=3133305 RepID=UPI003F63E900